MSVVEINSLDIRLRAVHVLKNISITVHERERLAVLGPNGAGKTSLLRCILGLFRKTSGTINLLGTAVTRRPVERLPVIGAALGTPAFYENMTVLDHLRIVSSLRHQGRVRKDGLLSKSVNEFGLEGHLHKKLENCSSGVRKRLAICCAFMGEPDLIILDDPTAELDVGGIKQLKAALVKVQEKRQATIILATHSLSLARECSESVLMLDDGKQIFNGNWDDFDSVIGGLYEIEIDEAKAIPSSQLPQSLNIRSLEKKEDSKYLLDIESAKINDLVTYLVKNKYKIKSIVPVPLTSDEFRKKLHGLKEPLFESGQGTASAKTGDKALHQQSPPEKESGYLAKNMDCVYVGIGRCIQECDSLDPSSYSATFFFAWCYGSYPRANTGIEPGCISFLSAWNGFGRSFPVGLCGHRKCCKHFNMQGLLTKQT